MTPCCSLFSDVIMTSNVAHQKQNKRANTFLLAVEKDLIASFKWVIYLHILVWNGICFSLFHRSITDMDVNNAEFWLTNKPAPNVRIGHNLYWALQETLQCYIFGALSCIKSFPLSIRAQASHSEIPTPTNWDHSLTPAPLLYTTLLVWMRTCHGTLRHCWKGQHSAADVCFVKTLLLPDLILTMTQPSHNYLTPGGGQCCGGWVWGVYQKKS